MRERRTTVIASGAGAAKGAEFDAAAAETRSIRATGELDLEYITWNLPRTERDSLSRSKSRCKHVTITPSLLFEPGSHFLRSTSGSEGSWFKKRCSQFTTTESTRCVQDLKRPLSWKIYGISCNPTTNVEAHYVRISFSSSSGEKTFSALSELLNALAAKRFLQSSRSSSSSNSSGGIRPFGIGFDAGVASKERCYIISTCAKQTPVLRRVSVFLETSPAGSDTWTRAQGCIDRIGFATYRGAMKSGILGASTLAAVRFKDDAYLRFARVTLRFGERSERTVVDVGRTMEPQLVYTRTGTVLSVSGARLRTCEGRAVSAPVHTRVRLVFADSPGGGGEGGGRRGRSKRCAAEAEKALALLKRTVQTAAANTLGLPDDVGDSGVFEMGIQHLRSSSTFSIRPKGSPESTPMPLHSLFKSSTLFLAPCYDTNGAHLVLQSRSGDFVLRQYVASPLRFIAGISADGFDGPKFSVLVDVLGGREYDASGVVRYVFETGETDAAALVEMMVGVVGRLHIRQTETGVTPIAEFTPPASTPSALTPPPPPVSPVQTAPPFVALPRIPKMPSIHLSRPTTPRPSSPPPPMPAVPVSVPVSVSVPVPVSVPVSVSVPAPAPVPAPVPAPTTPPLLPAPSLTTSSPAPTIYKVPRKPLPPGHTPHARSTSLSSASTTASTALSLSPSASTTSSSSSSRLARKPVPTHARSASAMSGAAVAPGGRLYELRTKTLQRVVTGVETGIGGVGVGVGVGGRTG